jgi:hypothetical protein
LKSPETPKEWQEAVDAAQGALRMEAAQRYGLIDPVLYIDIARSNQILQRGKEKGYEPASDAAERFLLSWMEQDARAGGIF